MTSPRTIIAAVLAAALAACGGAGDEPAAPDAGAEPTGELSLGRGQDDGSGGFIDVADGDDWPLIGGAQGGYHLWTALSARGVEGRVELVREARQVADDSLVLRAPAQVIEVPPSAMEDWWERPESTPSFMCPSPVGIQVYDQPLRLTGWLYDADGTLLAEDEIVVVPRCPTGDLEEHCLEVCGG